MESDLVEKMVGILDMRGEGFDKRLEVGIYVRLDTFSRGIIRRDNGAAGITWFVYFRQKVQGEGAGLGVEE